MNFIAHTPCDPDITREQVAAYQKFKEAIADLDAVRRDMGRGDE